jgi:hypothetical protein
MTEVATRDPGAELAAALAAVQAELPEIKKTRTAKVEKDGRLLYTYDYADLADVSLAILPILGRHGLAFMAVPGHQPDGKFGLRYYLLHSGGARIEGFYELAEQGGIQMVGGRITYARRYCLCAVTGVAAEDDVDARDDNDKPRTAQRKQRTPNSSSAQPTGSAPQSPPVPAGAAEGPPLPGEEDAPGPVNPPAGPGAPGDERHQKLVGIVQAHFRRLGFTDEEKPLRLEYAAVLANIDPITSLNDMHPDDLSPLADTLSRCRDREKLTALLVARDKGADSGE